MERNHEAMRMSFLKKTSNSVICGEKKQNCIDKEDTNIFVLFYSVTALLLYKL